MIKQVTTGVQNLLLCFEMAAAAIVHQWAFSYKEYMVRPRVSRPTYVSDHVALGDAVRDFNEVMPILIPTGFKPGPAQIETSQTAMDRAIQDNYFCLDDVEDDDSQGRGNHGKTQAGEGGGSTFGGGMERR